MLENLMSQSDNANAPTTAKSDFIRDMIAEDVQQGRNAFPA
jgi:hypothetical protein